MPYAEVNGTTLYYRVKGSGLPIIFVHPPLLEGNNFDDQLEQLSDTYQIITVDVRGHGRSPYSKQPLTIPLIAGDIRGLMDALEVKKACICGYSTGGSVALAAMLAYPGLFHGGILISAMSEVSDLMLRSRFWAAIYTSGLHAKRVLTAAITWGNASSPENFKKLYSAALRGDIRNHKQYYKSGLTYSCTQRLKEIPLPTLLLYGKKDSGFHKYAKMLHRQLPNSTLHFIPKAKHQLPTKWAGPTNRLIRQWIEAQPFATTGRRILRDLQETHVPIPVFEPGTIQEEPNQQA
ncbi:MULTISPECIES: alpha/beta fold hydrolase [unclassified Paenibacillus]|uniref:alpha/beta fold hydrolase n=1 Tax=unclassified Paenibacillus TaxID=185978 RepID=UPI001915A4A9|nr:alpha/beta hydrolase [Paenibacillus sp. EPM92]